MRIKDVPLSPAYVVFHDAYDNGAMDVWPAKSIAEASERANLANSKLESMGQDECGGWEAYTKLPRVKVFKYHTAEVIP